MNIYQNKQLETIFNFADSFLKNMCPGDIDLNKYINTQKLQNPLHSAH